MYKIFIKINFEALLSVPVVVTFIIALFFSIFFVSLDYLEKKKEVKNDKELKKKKSFYRLRLFFTFLLGLCAIYEAYSHKEDEIASNRQQTKQDSTINSKQDLITAITLKLDSTSNKLNEKNDALISSQKDINKAQSRTIQLQDELFNQITGGNSMALLQLKIKGSDFVGNDVKPYDFQLLQLHLINFGKYPIENLSIKYYTTEDRRQKFYPRGSKNYTPQKVIIQFRNGEPKNTILLQNLHLYAMEEKTIKNINLDFDTTDLIDVNWNINVFWRNAQYSYNFKTIPPSQNDKQWEIENLSISSDGKILTKEELIPYIQKKLKNKNSSGLNLFMDQW